MITRFAPSPTGPLHLGHAYSAIMAHDMARAVGGTFLLRIEDIDTTRARPEWERQIFEDLAWLGLTWDGEVMRQSERIPEYRQALQNLWQDNGVLYPCSCTRKDIMAALNAPQEGDGLQYGPDGLIYPGTCRNVARQGDEAPENRAIRMNMANVLSRLDPNAICFFETGSLAGGQPTDMCFSHSDLLQNVGDIVLSRKDFVGSYHLSVVLDDAAQGITHVVRGEDLFEATKIHVVLQHLLGVPTPSYHHHALIRDEQGKRLAKRDDARAISKYRAEGATPRDIRDMVGLV
ncbi:MAG: tRNA glutamyl-Q(34) synthetase GluQRS [Paracoccaceae bacterium]